MHGVVESVLNTRHCSDPCRDGNYSCAATLSYANRLGYYTTKSTSQHLGAEGGLDLVEADGREDVVKRQGPQERQGVPRKATRQLAGDEGPVLGRSLVDHQANHVCLGQLKDLGADSRSVVQLRGGFTSVAACDHHHRRIERGRNLVRCVVALKSMQQPTSALTSIKLLPIISWVAPSMTTASNPARYFSYAW